MATDDPLLVADDDGFIAVRGFALVSAWNIGTNPTGRAHLLVREALHRPPDSPTVPIGGCEKITVGITS